MQFLTHTGIAIILHLGRSRTSFGICLAIFGCVVPTFGTISDCFSLVGLRLKEKPAA